MKLSDLQIVILIFIFLALQEKSFSLARRVKKVHVVTTKKEMGVEGDSDYFFGLQKEIVPVESSFARIGGRKMTAEAIKGRSRNNKRVSKASKSGDEEDDSIDNLMAFSSDYHPPKPHPPKNN